MTDRLRAGVVIDAATLTLEHAHVGVEQTVAGEPTTALHEVDDTVGVWEMRPGSMSDIEIDEVFVVLSGDATVDFIDPALPSIELVPGAVVRLNAGMRTIWTVRETLRKVYVAL